MKRPPRRDRRRLPAAPTVAALARPEPESADEAMEQIRLALMKVDLSADLATEPASPDAPDEAGRDGAGARGRNARLQSRPAGRRVQKIGIEERLGAHWAVIVGGVALAFGALLLVKYSIEQGFFGPGLRVAGGLVLGFGLIAAGEYLRRRERRRKNRPKARRFRPC